MTARRTDGVAGVTWPRAVIEPRQRVTDNVFALLLIDGARERERGSRDDLLLRRWRAIGRAKSRSSAMGACVLVPSAVFRLRRSPSPAAGSGGTRLHGRSPHADSRATRHRRRL